MISMITNTYEKNAQIMMKQNSYDNLREYMKQIEGLYQNMRSFKHDYANIMVSMAGYMELDDMEGLKEYYNKQVFPMSTKLNKEKDTIARLHNLDIIELKSLISVKLNYAQELNIEVNLEIIEKIDTVNMKVVDLARIIGILLDNAIEACQKCTHPHIDFSVIKFEKGVTIIVRNTYKKQEIDYNKLGNIGISSKGERRGTGLFNIRCIVNEYDNVIMDTEYEEKYFTQIIEIYSNI
jgi:two-component system sensor histidine kinase AgrC